MRSLLYNIFKVSYIFDISVTAISPAAEGAAALTSATKSAIVSRFHDLQRNTEF